MVSLSVFDAYSHHPYTVGGTKDIAPEAMPHYPNLTVSLGNISTLLKIFPTKPFYITEYGYYTEYRIAMGIYVNQVTQARFLPRAYAYAARFPQIKALIWFPYHDAGPADPPPDNGGVYSGLVTTTGAFKLSWYRLLRRQQADAQVGGARRQDVPPVGRTHLGRPGRALRQGPRPLPQDGWSLVAGREEAHHQVRRRLPCDFQGAVGKTYFKVAWLGVTRSSTLTVR